MLIIDEALGRVTVRREDGTEGGSGDTGGTGIVRELESIGPRRRYGGHRKSPITRGGLISSSPVPSDLAAPSSGVLLGGAPAYTVGVLAKQLC